MFGQRRSGPLNDGQVRELVEEIVRKAMNEQARELEKHFTDIDRRLKLIEKKR
jgi:hypothetical protein